MVDRTKVVCSDLLVDGYNATIAGVTGVATFSDVVAPGIMRLERFQVTHLDLAGGGLSMLLALGSLAASKDAVINNVWAYVSQAFAGGAVSDVGCIIGENGTPDADAYVIGPVNIDVTGYVGNNAVDKGTAFTDSSPAILPGGADVTITVNTVGGTCDDLSAGSMFVYVSYFLLP